MYPSSGASAFAGPPRPTLLLVIVPNHQHKSEGKSNQKCQSRVLSQRCTTVGPSSCLLSAELESEACFSKIMLNAVSSFVDHTFCFQTQNQSSSNVLLSCKAKFGSTKNNTAKIGNRLFATYSLSSALLIPPFWQAA